VIQYIPKLKREVPSILQYMIQLSGGIQEDLDRSGITVIMNSFKIITLTGTFRKFFCALQTKSEDRCQMRLLRPKHCI
jgi:hypothetical protein